GEAVHPGGDEDGDDDLRRPRRQGGGGTGDSRHPGGGRRPADALRGMISSQRAGSVSDGRGGPSLTLPARSLVRPAFVEVAPRSSAEIKAPSDAPTPQRWYSASRWTARDGPILLHLPRA